MPVYGVKCLPLDPTCLFMLKIKLKAKTPGEDQPGKGSTDTGQVEKRILSGHGRDACVVSGERGACVVSSV